MRTSQFFFITTLPALGELGSAPPMGLADLLEHVGEMKWGGEALEAILLLDDLAQRESLLVGEIEEVEPTVLSIQQARGEGPLPEKLFSELAPERKPAVEIDSLWAGYFRYVHAVAGSTGGQFLRQWVEFEVTLRNSLATARARRLGLDESAYLVASELASQGEDLSQVLSEWESASTPLAGLRVTLRARWAWLERHDSWYSFSIDELLAYAARIMLLQQWRRSAEKEDAAA